MSQTSQPSPKVEEASRAIQNLIWLIELKQIVLWCSDDARREILAMLRFFHYSVTKGVTPEASAVAAQEFIASIQKMEAPSALEKDTE